MFRKHFNATTIVAIVALVFAMTGGAYAAKHYLITNTKQISPKVLKQLKGKNGKNGANGAAGANGKDGAQGLPGKDGTNGTNGANGANGVSVASKEVTTKEAACAKQGGVELTAAENKKTTLCNGKEGSPWTAGGTLPSGKTETGTWFGVSSATKLVRFAISFPIPLESPIPKTIATVHIITFKGFKENKVPAGCSGGTPTKPKAAAGNFCLFEGELSEEEPLEEDPLAQEPGVGKAVVVNPGNNGSEIGTAGVAVELFATAENALYGGTWAVTAP